MSSINISYSSELISNYMQAETVSPDHKFAAVQTHDGHSLLFSIGTNGVFYMTEEISGISTGWVKNDLSSALAGAFPTATSLAARTFAVEQNEVSNLFTLAMVLTVDGNDHLYVADTYTRNPDQSVTVNWTAIPFDATGTTAPASLANVYVTQTATAPLIVVDAINPSDGAIDRYFIDTQNAVSDQCWNLFNLPVDMDGSQPVQICGGCKAGGFVNGIYSLGTVGGKQSIVYQELYDPFGLPEITAGATSRLNLPEGTVPQAIASTPSAQTTSNNSFTYTDLYATTSAGELYFFAADKQQDKAVGVKLATNALLADVNALFAYTDKGKTVVWGLNRAQQVFYMQSSTFGVAMEANWSYPLPLGNQIEQISPYINRVNGGNTFFAHIGTNSFKKVFQDPISTTWQTQDILLPADPSVTAQKYDSYTTQINVVDAYNAPVANATVKIGSTFRVPVYVNNHYYVLDTTAIDIPTDNQGCITVIQRIENTVGAGLKVQAVSGGDILSINPMQAGVTKVISIDSADGLSKATTTDDKGNSPKPLVSPDTSTDDLNAAAASLQSLSSAYSAYAPTTTSVTATGTTTQLLVQPSAKKVSASDSVSSLGDAIVVAAGDLFSFLDNAVDYVIDIIEDTAKNVWNFVCTIGGKIFTFVIDTIEKVVGAIEAVFQALKTLVKDLIQFMKFLFAWGDIQRTKDVFKNMTMVFLQDSLNSMAGVKTGLDAGFARLENALNSWAGLPAESTSSSATMNSTMASQNGQQSSSTSSFLQYHFVNNAANATTTDTSSNEDGSLVASLFDSLVESLKDEAQIIQDAVTSLWTEIFEDGQYRTMTFQDLVKKVIGILGDALIETAQNVTDTLLDMVIAVAGKVISILESPIWIPVLSDILEEFFDTTIPFSWIDVIMLVGAMPATIGYKILTGNAPFTQDDGFSDSLLAAKSVDDIFEALGKSVTIPSNSLRLMVSASDAAQPSDGQIILFQISRVISATSSILSAIFFPFVNTPGIENLQALKIANVCNQLVGSLSNATVQVFAQPAPVRNTWFKVFNFGLIGAMVTEKAIFAGYMIYAKVKNKDTKAADLANKVLTLVFQGINVIFIAEHLIELGINYEDDPKLSNLAIVQAMDQFCAVGNASMNLAATFAPEGGGKNIVIGVGVGIDLVAATLQCVQVVYAGIEA
ncbi:MAG: hypothetical protein IPN95_31775 [Bacteroidetes bacterium]|nr:hypothetical protein [Bacteroidota bacterium]